MFFIKLYKRVKRLEERLEYFGDRLWEIEDQTACADNDIEGGFDDFEFPLLPKFPSSPIIKVKKAKKAKKSKAVKATKKTK